MGIHFGEPLTPTQVGTTVKQRQKISLVRTYSGLGIKAPFDKKSEVGYRPMMYHLTHLKQLVAGMQEGTLSPKQRDEIDEQFRFADIANDECDFGLNLELGLNLFALVVKKDEVLWHTYRVLEMAYGLLGRDVFRHILRCHLNILAVGGIRLEPL